MLKLSISDKYGNIKKGRNDYEEESHNLESAGDTMCYIASQDFIFEEGDEINIFVAQKNQYLMVKLDESLDSTIVFIPSHSWTYRINMEQTAKEAMPDHRFKSKRHYLGVRYATNEEIRRYQNWALNPHDQKEFSGAYPHASANVETRNDATLTIDFGRLVEVDKIGITIRADFPHDSYWTEVTLLFSDASSETFSLQKNTSPQFFYFKKRAVTYVQLTNLVKAEDESPFPALTEFEVYGINKL